LKQGIILFAHGSRDAAWARPFERIAASLEKRSPDCAVKLAYLELMRPSLDEAFKHLAEAGASSIRVVPVFLGQGSHLREDLPRLVDAVRSAFPRIRVSLEKPIGEQPRVIEAIAEVIASQGGRSSP
jgi:sirohydrochlorin cobaltochelatase